MKSSDKSDYVIAIVGVGPYGLSVFERICANLLECSAGRKVQVHLIDPYLGHGGKVWRGDQSDQLWMNSLAGSVSLFVDESLECAGPVRSGPTLSQWAINNGRPLSVDRGLDELVGASSGYRWASRSLMGDYMRWFLDFVTESAPESVQVHRHERQVVDIRSVPESPAVLDEVWLEGESLPIQCHRVILAQGNPQPLLTDEQSRLVDLLPLEGGTYTPPGPATSSSVAAIGPGEPTLVRGMGLTFFDYLQLLTKERGGVFHHGAGGRIHYEPSGTEPYLFVTSGRGVPYRPVIWPLGKSRFSKCTIPRHVSSERIRDFSRNPKDADELEVFRRMILGDLEYAYYAELISSNPGICSIPWDRFSRLFLDAAPGSPLRGELVRDVIADKEDQLDLESMRDPLKGISFESVLDLQKWMRRYIAHGTNQMLSVNFGGYQALLTVAHRFYSEFARLSNSEQEMKNLDFFRGVQGWLRSILQFLNGGAPWPRQKELIALSRSGVVTFLGAKASLEQSSQGQIECTSATLPHTSIDITHVIDARIAQASVSHSSDVLRGKLYGRGEMSALARHSRAQTSKSPGVEAIRVTNFGEVIHADGSVSRTRFVIGVATSYRIVTPGLPTAHTNSDFLLMTDRVARRLLDSLGIVRPASDSRKGVVSMSEDVRHEEGDKREEIAY
ncbi:FAD/NAD(P)-binding protein [Streptomyces sp. JV184]|uniref:FAD/NAD(P)-binding protein n=1 Tax=Streptomyces sp. JV184 TaxID=858637 RepID=UPI002E78791F|nr:FAD/NAD(P)-binding protein [Streptomyces sp. JV184]MEE1750697.1 FAD/NAD(P)-binding protein [Streptomyces sp. JV184]